MAALLVTHGLAGGLGTVIVTDFVQRELTIAFLFILPLWIYFKTVV